MKVLKLSLIFVPLLVACGDTGVDNTDVAHTNSAIVGGITDEGHMYVVGVGDGQAPWCSATVISTNTVLTAAHCVDGMPPSHVHFGTDLLVPHTTMVVSQAVVHPSWAGGTGSDLALLKTQQPMPVQPAVLLRKTLNNSPVYMGPDWTFVGYGVDDGIQGTGFGTKRVAAFPYKTLGPTTTAADQMPVSADFIYYETNIQSGCNGDSGGPSFFIDGMVEKQGAVTSWGSPGCQQYGVYARVDQPYIAAFVQPNIDLFEPNNACKNDGSCNESCNTTEVFDPDCAAAHCAADGVCAVACVNPVDPDCAFLAVNHCGEDGVCDLNCGQPDPDCDGATSSSSSSSASSSSSSSSSSSASSSSSSTGASSSSASGAGGGGAGGGGVGGGGAGGAGGAPPRDDYYYDNTMLFGRGCSVGEGPANAPPHWGWLLALVPWLRRRRRGSSHKRAANRHRLT